MPKKKAVTPQSPRARLRILMMMKLRKPRRLALRISSPRRKRTPRHPSKKRRQRMEKTQSLKDLNNKPKLQLQATPRKKKRKVRAKVQMSTPNQMPMSRPSSAKAKKHLCSLSQRQRLRKKCSILLAILSKVCPRQQTKEFH